MQSIEFKKRELTRTATPEEKSELTKRLLEVLSSIDATKEEAKAAAAEYRSILSDLHKREIGLRFNLQNNTVTHEIDVHAVADEAANIMQYFDRDGNLVDELTHPLSQEERNDAAIKRQLNMFAIAEALEEKTSQNITELESAFGDISGLPDAASHVDSVPSQETEGTAEPASPKADKKRKKQPEPV